MLDLETRTAILRLHREGHGARRIARELGVSRNAVKKVIRSGRAAVPHMQGRETALDSELNRIRELHVECKGNQVRVHEKLADAGVEVAYSTLTAFCRRHLIGVKVREPVGRYEYAPGAEMQHDTSPHDVAIGGRLRGVQCASLVLGYPTEHLVEAVRDALRYGLLDLARIERMTLRRVRGDFFQLPVPDDEEDDDG